MGEIRNQWLFICFNPSQINGYWWPFFTFAEN